MTARVVGVLACLLTGCSEDARPTFALPSRDECFAQRDGVACSDGVALTCREGKVEAREDCNVEARACVDRLGCRACAPLSIACEGDALYRCRSDGSLLELVEACIPGLSCSPLGCRDLCADARADRSYLGCDYWPVFTSNRQLSAEFFPAVAVGNGNLVAAQVVITRAGQVVAERTIEPRSSATIELAYDDALRRSVGSSVVPDGAYHLRASVPVTVHQYNPLFFELAHDCAEEPEARRSDMRCNSYTNDAALLFPTDALRPDSGEDGGRVSYLVAARTTFMAEGPGGFGMSPGFVAVVAMGEQPVRVSVRSTAHTLPSADGLQVAALAPGGTLDLTLAPGAVLQLLSTMPSGCPGTLVTVEGRRLCDPGPAYDLTGTEITADGPVQVVSGHDCTNVPIDRVACDHLEESMMPLRAWGTSALLTRPRVDVGSPSLLRVLSGADANQIRFEPALFESLTLARGQWLELAASEAVLVRGTGRLLVAQYLLGQGRAGGNYAGDPSLSIGVPIDQYRDRYNFVTPATYRVNYLDVIAPTGSAVTLDGTLVTNFAPVGTSGLSVASIVLARPGAHELRGAAGRRVGIVLYGLGAYTSYMLPGGLDLRRLSEPAL